MQVIDVVWRPLKEGFKSGLLAWQGDSNEPFFLQLQPTQEVRWSIEGPRICIGSRGQSGLERCPKGTLLGKRGIRCGPCSAQDTFDVCVRCDGYSCLANDERRKKCEVTEYAIYIAVFNDRTVKIGVSKKDRVLTRLVEQGADYASIIKTITGGGQARVIEDKISRVKGLTKNVRSGRKIDSLTKCLMPDDAEELVKEVSMSAGDLTQNPTDIIDLSKYYSLQGINKDPQLWHKSSESIAELQLLGEIVGMKGPLMVTRLAGALTVVNLKELQGYSINTEKDITIVTQSGLSDFF